MCEAVTVRTLEFPEVGPRRSEKSLTQERAHHPSGPLTLAAVLAVVAGLVDAHVYVHVTPVFVANMSGNLVHLGIFAGLGSWRAAVGSTVAIVSFLLGVVAAVIHHDRRLRRRGRVGADSLLGVEAALVLLLPVLLWASGAGFSAEPQLVDYPILIVAAFAMGLQAAAIRRVGEIAVATTYGTGAIVRIGEKLALAARRADRATDHRRRFTIAVLIVVLMSYVTGAAIATLIGGGTWILVVAGLVLAVLSVAVRRTGDDLGTAESAQKPD